MAPWLVARSPAISRAGGHHPHDERDVGNIPVFVADDHRVESHVAKVDGQGEGERVGLG
jgi:hypothetical protein